MHSSNDGFSPEQEFFYILLGNEEDFFMVRQTHQKLKIYTKTGDNGKTSLFGGKRVSKADLRIEVYGEIDELNSIVGIVISKIRNPILRLRSGQEPEIRNKLEKSQISKIKNELFEIQKDLFEISSTFTLLNTKYLKNRINEFENLIEEMDEKLPELNNFILPGGGETGSLLHLARSVCRRVERRMVKLAKKEKVNPQIIVYFNRLSDLLFVMARFVNFQEKQKEMIWARRAFYGKRK